MFTTHSPASSTSPRRARRHPLRAFAVATIAAGSIVGLCGLTAGSAGATTVTPATTTVAATISPADLALLAQLVKPRTPTVSTSVMFDPAAMVAQAAAQQQTIVSMRDPAATAAQTALEQSKAAAANAANISQLLLSISNMTYSINHDKLQAQNKNSDAIRGLL